MGGRTTTSDDPEIQIATKWDRVRQIAREEATKKGDEIMTDQRVEQLQATIKAIDERLAKETGEVRRVLEEQRKVSEDKLDVLIAYLGKIPQTPAKEERARCANPKCGATLIVPSSVKAGDFVTCGRCKSRLKLSA